MAEVTRDEFENLQNHCSELHIELDQYRQLSLEMLELMSGKAALMAEAGLCMACGDADHGKVRAVADRVSGLAKGREARADDGQDTLDEAGNVTAPAKFPRNMQGAMARIAEADAKASARMAELATELRGNAPPAGRGRA